MTLTLSREHRLAGLYTKHHDKLFRLLIRLTRSRLDAEDAEQEAWLRAWNHLDEVEDDRAYRWLSTVARHIVIDIHRRTRIATVALDENVRSSADDLTEQFESRHMAITMLAQLSSDHQRVLMGYMYGQTAREMAVTLGIPEGTVKSRIFYALRAARQIGGGGR